MIDTHNHLYVEQFNDDLEEVLKRAKEAGVTEHFFPSIDSNYTERMYDLEAKFPNRIRLMMGLHPTHVKLKSMDKELDFVYKQLKKRPFAAVGEIGIDLYWDKSTLDIQVKAFEQQIIWAKEFGLPIILHIRDSFPEVFEVLEKHKDDKLFGIFHCFTGTLEDAQHAIDLGFSLGIGGVVTFKNGKIDKFLNEIDLKHIVLETDSPYLAPKPFRGKRNEPSFLKHVADKLTKIYSISYDELTAQTTINANRIFSDYKLS